MTKDGTSGYLGRKGVGSSECKDDDDPGFVFGYRNWDEGGLSSRLYVTFKGLLSDGTNIGG